MAAARLISFNIQPSPLRSSQPLHDAIGQFLSDKQLSGRRPSYITGLRTYLTLLSEWMPGATVAEIDHNILRKWFLERDEAPCSTISNLGRLSAFFTYCKRRGWISENPIERIDRPMVDRKAPKILSPENATKLLRIADAGTGRNLAPVALSLFAGVRPQELDRVSWESVQEDRGIMTVDAEASKVRHRRIVHLMPAAVEWMRYARKRASKLPWCRTARQRFIQRFKKEMGVEWQPDILRHTAASYWLAAVPDADRVALELGNSPTILLRHYRELVSKEDSDRFWGIMP